MKALLVVHRVFNTKCVFHVRLYDYMAIKINWIIYTEPCVIKLNQSQSDNWLCSGLFPLYLIFPHACAKFNYHRLNFKENTGM